MCGCAALLMAALSSVTLVYFQQVMKDYEAFEKLQKDITQMFQELKLPALPRKFHLFIDSNDIEERQVAFDCLLKVLSRDKAMSVSIPMLQFLGFDLLADKKYFKVHIYTLFKCYSSNCSTPHNTHMHTHSGKERVSAEDRTGQEKRQVSVTLS